MTGKPAGKQGYARALLSGKSLEPWQQIAQKDLTALPVPLSWSSPGRSWAGDVLLAQAQAAPWAGDVSGPRASSSGTAQPAPRQGPAGPSPSAGSPRHCGGGRKLRAQQCGLESRPIWGCISFLPAVPRAVGTQKPGLMALVGSTRAVRATSFLWRQMNICNYCSSNAQRVQWSSLAV